jgi:uncharacterized protein
MEWALIAVITVVAGVLSAVTGFGGAAILLPVLVVVMGSREAVVTLTVAQLIGNLSRVWFNRHDLDLQVIGWFATGAIPLTIIGALIFTRAPLSILTPILGAALILLVIGRRVLKRSYPELTRSGWIAAGAGLGLLSALVGTSGPLAAPLFLGRNLTRGAYIGTEAATAALMHAVKLVVYGSAFLVTTHTSSIGGLLGCGLLLGAYIGKLIVDRLPEGVFVLLVEIGLIAAGIRLLWTG